MARDHDKVFKSMSAQDKDRMIKGELIIVTQGKSTTVEEAPKPNFKLNTTTLFRPTHPWVGAKRGN